MSLLLGTYFTYIGANIPHPGLKLEFFNLLLFTTYLPGANNTSFSNGALLLNVRELIAGYRPGGNISSMCFAFILGMPTKKLLAVDSDRLNEAKEFCILPEFFNFLMSVPFY